MNSEPDAQAHQPNEPSRADAHTIWPTLVDCKAAPGAVTFTYSYELSEESRLLSLVHDRPKGLYILTKPDGTTELFRDKPDRYLVVEPDPQTGELRPAAKRGQPVYLYLCREQREG
jgi:hypothetical protein